MDTGPPSPTIRITPQLIFGLLILVVGIIFTLDNLDVLEAERYLAFWPAGLIIIGASKVWHARTSHGSYLGGMLFLAAGTWMLLRRLGVVDVHILSLWPLLLVVGGILVVWQSIRGPRRHGEVVNNSVVNAVAILSGVQRVSNSRNFRGGELTAFMGGCGVDLRQAEIHGEAVIDVFAMWGGIDIRVPESWNVIDQVTPIMGGYEDATRATGDARTHTLVIRGIVLMGGVEVKN